MKIRTMAFVLTLAVSAANAQRLDVEFTIIEDYQAAGCAGSIVDGLKPSGDGFLAVRTGPRTEFRQIDKLHNGYMVRICVIRGRWVGVDYRDPRQKG